MALQFNPFLTNVTGFTSALLSTYQFASGLVIKVFPDTVSFPASKIESSASIPGGHILTYSSMTCGISGNFIVITAGTTTVATTAAGTLSWFSIHHPTYGGYVLLSDSINTAGNGAILSVSTLTPTNGQNVSITFSLRFV